MSFLSKLKFFINKPKIIIVMGRDKTLASEAIFIMLKQHFRLGKEVLIFQAESNENETGKIGYLLKYSSLAVVVATSSDKEYKYIEELRYLVRTFPDRGFLISNFDDETMRQFRTAGHSLTFGFKKGADFLATDIKINGGVNFKITYKGSVVPFWLAGGKEKIYPALAASAAGTAFGLNLVEISQAFKSAGSIDK